MSEGAIEGGCNCGAIRYRIDAAPLAVAACHCVNCRRQSGAAFSVNLIVAADAVRVAGSLAVHADPDTGSGKPVLREFCGGCGSPIRSTPTATPAFVAIKAGTLDNPSPFRPTMHLWTCTALDWVDIPEGVKRFEKGPVSA